VAGCTEALGLEIESEFETGFESEFETAFESEFMT
jgi:hypothetical protein